MTYTPTTWEDETPAELPVRFRLRDGDGNIIHDNVTIEVVTSLAAGTPVNAAKLNNMEAGIADAHDSLADVAAQLAGSIPALFTAAGDLVYASAAGVAAVLAAGSTPGLLMRRSDAGLPEWAGPVFKRVGGSGTNWDANGETVYSAEKCVIQCGVAIWSGTAAASGSKTVTFPVPFSGKPICFASSSTGLSDVSANAYSPNVNSIIILWRRNSGAVISSLLLTWLAIGPVE